MHRSTSLGGFGNWFKRLLAQVFAVLLLSNAGVETSAAVCGEPEEPTPSGAATSLEPHNVEGLQHEASAMLEFARQEVAHTQAVLQRLHGHAADPALEAYLGALEEAVSPLERLVAETLKEASFPPPRLEGLMGVIEALHRAALLFRDAREVFLEDTRSWSAWLAVMECVDPGSNWTVPARFVCVVDLPELELDLAQIEAALWASQLDRA